MIIKLKCTNDVCGYSYEVSEAELRDNGHLHKTCLICQSKLKVDNLQEVVNTDIEREIKNNVDLWFNKMGIEYTIEMIERNKSNATYRLYKAEVEKRGFKLKE